MGFVKRDNQARLPRWRFDIKLEPHAVPHFQLLTADRVLQRTEIAIESLGRLIFNERFKSLFVDRA